MTQRTPRLEDVIRNAMSARLADVHTAMPGEVVSYDASTRTAEVKVLVKRLEEDPEGNFFVAEYPNIFQAPVATFGVGGWIMAYPLEAGDSVLLIFSEHDIEDWQELSGVQEPADPRRHHLSDAIIIPGLLAKPDAEGAQTPSANGMVIGKNANDGQIFLGDAEIALGGEGASDWVSKDSLVQSELGAVRDKLDELIDHYLLHTHPVSGALASKTDLPTPLPTPPAALGDTKSDLVKLKD